jgi:hypothetical protein
VLRSNRLSYLALIFIKKVGKDIKINYLKKVFC